MRKSWLVFLLIAFIFINHTAGQQHKLFTEILAKHIKGGLVNYKELKNDNRLDEYLNQLENTDPDTLKRNEKLAFWINAYNAFTLTVIVDNYPIESINELHTGGRMVGHLLGKTVWDKEFITISNKQYSLNDIEHNILRKMNEPRIHFSIVCASISCPTLRTKAFEADRINEQLEVQAHEFINDKSKNSFDVKNRKAYLSKIFDWFDEDFGISSDEILKYISQFLPENTAKEINSHLSEWKLTYNDYNWNLNEIK